MIRGVEGASWVIVTHGEWNRALIALGRMWTEPKKVDAFLELTRIHPTLSTYAVDAFTGEE